MAEMKIIHVGVGADGQPWLERIHREAGLRSIGCVDRDATARTTAARRLSIGQDACYSDLDEALAKSGADGAVVGLPVAERAAVIVRLLEAGLSVLVEQPFAADLAAAAQVLNAVKRAGRRLIVARPESTVGCEETLRGLLHRGTIGQVTHVTFIDKRAGGAENAPGKNESYAQLQQTGISHFDALRHIIAADPIFAMARTTKAPWSPYAHGSTTEASFGWANNICVQYHATLTGNQTEQSLWIDGTTGVLKTDGRRVWWRKRGWPIFVPLLRRNSGNQPSALQAFKHGPTSQEFSALDRVASIALFEAAIASDRARRLASVADLAAAAGIDLVDGGHATR
jgi:predicted dehydrogenase